MRISITSLLLISLAFFQCQAYTIVTSDAAAAYNGYCYGCIFNGFRYCEDFGVCLSTDSFCPKGKINTVDNGCPVLEQCPVANKGVAFIGNSNSTEGGIGLSGSLKVNASSSRPCVLTIVNTAFKDTELNVVGENGQKVGALASTLNYTAQTINQFRNINASYVLNSYEIVTNIYIGSTKAGENQIATVKWSPKPENWTPTQSANYLNLKALATLVSTLLLVIYG